ncbi:MAG TPA: XrtA system polysaccharide chain length determinant [Steroidobacteraceae bacterium]|nr:XrtA system polysaccharide chain length determinant [Steroidobacteraceae bacterium]
MQEILSQLLVALQGMLRYRWHALAFAWALAVVGWIGVMVLPDNYEARAKVYVDTDSVLKPLLRGLTAENDVMTEVNMMSRALLAQPQMEKVARETDLYLRAKGPKEFERLIDNMRERITIEMLPQAPNLYSIRYLDHHREMAERVVRELLDSFVEDTRLAQGQDTSSAQRFLEEQIRAYEQKLREAEDRLAAFKKENVGKMPGEEGDYYERLQVAMQRMETLRAELKIAQDKRDQAALQLEGEEPTFGIMNNMVESASPLAGQLTESRKQLDKLLLKYTEKHPEVRALKDRIAALEEQMKTEKTGGVPQVKTSELAVINSIDQNPVYQQMKMALSSAEIVLTETRSKLRETEKEVASLRASVNTIPEVEAKLAQLNRDYEVNKAQHSALLKSLESAKLSEDVEQSRDDVRFRVIEPPVAPLRPVSPNRPLFVAVVLLGAIAAGCGLAFLMHQLNPVFATRQSLRDSLADMPVLGSVTLALSPKQVAVERRDRLRLAAAAGLLVVAFVIALVLEPYASVWLQGLLKG